MPDRFWQAQSTSDVALSELVCAEDQGADFGLAENADRKQSNPIQPHLLNRRLFSVTDVSFAVDVSAIPGSFLFESVVDLSADNQRQIHKEGTHEDVGQSRQERPNPDHRSSADYVAPSRDVLPSVSGPEWYVLPQ